MLVATSIQHPFRLKPSSECHGALPLSGPSVISLFDKNPETQTQEEVAVPLKTFSCPLTDSHTEMSNHGFQEHYAISYLYVALSAPAAHWEVHVLYLDNPLSPTQLLLLLMTPLAGVRPAFHYHHVLRPGRLSHRAGPHIPLTVPCSGTPLN